MKKLLVLVALALFSLSTPQLSYAQSLTLEQAKQQLAEAKDNGWVGEQPDGYLGIVVENATAKQIAEQINEARRQEYVRIAEENDIAVADVELLAGKRAIERTDKGHYVKINGEWKKK